MDKRITLLDVLKGICIIFVIVEHSGIPEKVRFFGLFPFWISMAVPVFMLITGYLYAASFSRNGVNSLKEAYRLPLVYKKAVRFIIPYAIIYLLRLFLDAINNHPNDIFLAVASFINGGSGAGSYYFPIMLQLIFIFPLIYFPMKNSPRGGVVAALFFNLIYEILQRSYYLNADTYRLLIFRYTFLIAAGCFLYLNQEALKTTQLLCSCIIGTVYIVLVNYTNYSPKIIVYWTSTSFVTGFFVIPLFYLLITKFSNAHCKLLELLGKASFNILWVQMIYYSYIYPISIKNIESYAIRLAISIIICTLAGTLFYAVESRITKVFLKKTKPIIVNLERKFIEFIK